MEKRAVARISGSSLALAAICGIALALAGSVRAEAPSQDSCLAAALARPGNVSSDMSRPGNKWDQEILVRGDFESTPTDCLSLIVRQTPRAFFKMQRPKNHEMWIRTKGLVLVDESNDFQPIGGEGGTGTAVYGPPPGPPKPLTHFLYRCTPGMGITRVRVIIAIRATSAVDGRLLGRRSYSWPVHVQGGAFAFAGGVKRAC